MELYVEEKIRKTTAENIKNCAKKTTMHIVNRSPVVPRLKKILRE